MNALGKITRSSCVTNTILRSPLNKKCIVSAMGTNTIQVHDYWSGSISFASPEADFSASRLLTTSSDGRLPAESWSGALSFASPESDFTSMAMALKESENYSSDDELVSNNIIWSETMTFASPESDFSASLVNNNIGNESTTRMKEDFINHIQSDEYHRNNMAYALSHASTESDFTSPSFMDLLNDRMKAQLENVQILHEENTNTLPNRANPRELSTVMTTHAFETPTSQEKLIPIFSRPMFHEQPLPRNLAEATLPNDPRAIVITEAEMPFRIVSVNDSWEKLCGYSRKECKGQTLRCIQGPETNKAAITALMAQLLKGEEAGTLLTNYSKEGRKFHNRLRVGPLKNDSGKVTHFIGVLKEVHETGEHFDGNLMHA